MQRSSSLHSPGMSMELTAFPASSGSRSLVLAVATCTGGVSGGRVCEAPVDAASPIGAGSSCAAVVLVEGTVTAPGATATTLSPIAVACGASADSSEARVALVAATVAAPAAAATTVSPIALACGASTTSASAVRDGGGRSTIGAAAVFSMPAEPKPASQATTQPARTTVNAATVANRRGSTIATSEDSIG